MSLMGVENLTSTIAMEKVHSNRTKCIQTCQQARKLLPDLGLTEIDQDENDTEQLTLALTKFEDNLEYLLKEFSIVVCLSTAVHRIEQNRGKLSENTLEKKFEADENLRDIQQLKAKVQSAKTALHCRQKPGKDSLQHSFLYFTIYPYFLLL
ncbi:DgyrCDS12343 [Dimorphilus gyrociliatus]|uniref:DgyrCDS12343 n=1 Tax=Dimorphilus gyrociliatus TaxID=2664684 RepID=A0A7I8W663_9ANNE|nr:DgyrCDS12343 [Dimorphilus gyrociliatus]